MGRLHSRGFTLIELVSVIVILGIVAVLGSQFVASTQQAYQQSQLRAKLTNKGRLAIERMTRQLRLAVPHSWRVVGNCVEFLPIAGGGNYLGTVPDTANGAPAQAGISTAPFSLDFGTGRYVTIGAQSSGEIYGAGAVSRANLSAAIVANGQNLTLAAAKQWQRNSINQRFFLADNPQAFCLDGTNLNFYDAQNINAAGVSGSATELLADNVSSSGTAFSISAGTESRSALITIDLDFTEGSESVNLVQQVSLRNVP